MTRLETVLRLENDVLFRVLRRTVDVVKEASIHKFFIVFGEIREDRNRPIISNAIFIPFFIDRHNFGSFQGPGNNPVVERTVNDFRQRMGNMGKKASGNTRVDVIQSPTMGQAYARTNVYNLLGRGRQKAYRN